MAGHMPKLNVCDASQSMEEDRGGMRLLVRQPSHHPPGGKHSMLGLVPLEHLHVRLLPLHWR